MRPGWAREVAGVAAAAEGAGILTRVNDCGFFFSFLFFFVFLFLYIHLYIYIYFFFHWSESSARLRLRWLGRRGDGSSVAICLFSSVKMETGGRKRLNKSQR